MDLIKLTEQKNLPTILQKKVEVADFLIRCSKAELETYSTEIKVQESVGNGMSGLLRKEIGISKEVPYAIIERLLTTLALSVNVTNNIEPHQLSLLAKKIYSKYYYLSFDELIYVFNEGSLGKYGKLFNRLDTEIIFSWLEKYDTEERISLVEKISSKDIQEQKREKEQQEQILSELLKPIAEKLTAEMEAEKEKEEKYRQFKEQYFKK